MYNHTNEIMYHTYINNIISKPKACSFLKIFYNRYFIKTDLNRGIKLTHAEKRA